MLPEHALAMIQPWHPAMMYLIYQTVTEEEMAEQRIRNQPFPAGRRGERDEPDEAREKCMSQCASALKSNTVE